MGVDQAARKALERELLRRLDPGGELGAFIRSFDSVVGRGYWLLLGRLTGEDIEALVVQTKDLLSTMAGSILVFAPLGWAPSDRTPAEVYAEALRAYEATGSVEDAEQMLVEGWNSGDRLKFAVLPLSGLGAGDDRYRPIAEQRWRLVEKALGHHQARAYEASVPIVLAQVDGLVRDLTGSDFFSKKSHVESHLLNDDSLLGIPEGLRPLRALFAEDVRDSGAKGKLSRHGVLHGRELGYDTLINSTKAFVLLNAVVQWALPRARERVEQRQREREDLYAGTGAVDENGRQKDRRGFLHIKNWLDEVVAWREREAWEHSGRYSDDLGRMPLPPVPSFVREYPLTRRLEVSEDGREYWAWGVAPSGFCLGIAGRDGEAAIWHYAGTRPPSGGIPADSGWRHVARDPGRADW